jgi:hypothetical protein
VQRTAPPSASACLTPRKSNTPVTYVTGSVAPYIVESRYEAPLSWIPRAPGPPPGTWIRLPWQAFQAPQPTARQTSSNLVKVRQTKKKRQAPLYSLPRPDFAPPPPRASDAAVALFFDSLISAPALAPASP